MDSPIETNTKIRAGQEISAFRVGARLRIAAEYIKGEKFKEVQPLPEEAVKLEPNNALAGMILGKRLLSKGDVAGGVAELETVRKEAPESARTHWDLLCAYS
ncbi:MAG: hypothetical protein ACHQIK_19415 [Candidatus Acidiferrales bacterium]